MSDGGDSVDYRPPSDNLVDLHISIVPMEHWVERLNYASHKVIADTFSVGFIRVLPDTPLAKLRNEMRLQLGENFFPESYVFLKHVGRCLALVRKSQEKQLKVKTFLPPQSIMPEIFVLPGQPTMYNYSVLPPITPRMQDLHKPFSETESTSPELVPETIFKQHTPNKQYFAESDPVSESIKSQQLIRRESQKQKAIVDQMRRSMENDMHDGHNTVYKSQTASPPANKDIKRQKRHISGKSSLTGENPTKSAFPRGQRGRTTPGQASDAMSSFSERKQPEERVPDRSQPSQAKSVLHEGPQKRKVHYNMPTHSSTISSPGAESRGISQSSIVMEEKPPTNSTNNDSGYMEQDQSDSDDSTLNKMKMRLSSGSIHDHKLESQKQHQIEAFETTSTVWDDNRAPLTKSMVLERQHSPKNLHSFSREEQKAQVNRSQKTVPPSAENAKLRNKTNNDNIQMPSAMAKQLSNENMNEESKRSVSQESSNQFDFHERSSSTLASTTEQNCNKQLDSKPMKTLKPQSTLSNDEEPGSRLSNHLSEHEYHQQADYPTFLQPEHNMKMMQMSASFVKNQPTGTEAPHTDGLNPDISPSENTAFHPADVQKSKYNIADNEEMQSDYDNEEDNDDDYESSEDEFQKELNFMTIQHQQRMENEQIGESPDDENNYQPLAQTDVYHDSLSEKVKVKSPELTEQKKTKIEKWEELKQHDNPEKDQLMKRESISGLSEHHSPIIPPPGTTAVIAFVTTTTHDGKPDLSVANQLLQLHDDTAATQKDIKESDKVMSRGDPDGMPTQRKVNTGGSDKLTAKANIALDHAKQKSANEEPSVQKNMLSQTVANNGSVEKVQTVKHETAEVLESKLVEIPVVDSKETPKETKNDKDDTSKQIDVQRGVTHQASPSPIRIPKFHKPAVERQEVVTTPASSPKPNESKTSSEKQEPPSQVSTVKQEDEREKRLNSSDRAKLWSDLQNARNSRRLAEKERQDLVKQAKVTTSKLNQKRTSVGADFEKQFPRIKSAKKKQSGGEKCNVPGCYYVFHTKMDMKRHFGLIHRGKPIVRDMWKKKFFEEKKRTMPLEDICRRLQSELDTSHRRLVSALEGEKINEKRRYPTFLPSVTSRPSVKSNSKIQVTRLQHDMDGLRRKIEDAKIKLTGEIKLRHQAEEDVKVVRRELLTKKIRAHVAYREAIRGHGFPVRA